tara:strand:- start:6482 stop:7150 length:669 start_codon:yes stop_codon:yes gene_type:complete
MDILSGGYVKLLLYLTGLIISLLIGLLLSLGIGKNGNEIFLRKDSFFVKKLNKYFIDTRKACNIIEFPKLFGLDLSKYSVISLYTLFYGYTWSYLVLAKVFSGKKVWDGNDTFMTIIILLFSGTYSIFQIGRKCHWGYEGFFGFLLGLIFGFLWYYTSKPDFKEALVKKKCVLGSNNVWSCEGSYNNYVKKKPFKWPGDFWKSLFTLGGIGILCSLTIFIAK